MKIWKKMFVLNFIIFFSNFAFAKNLVFSCVQNVQAPKIADKITFLVEDFIFSSLFDAGQIASNVPFTSNDVDVLENVKTVIENLDNGSEYILIINLDYANDSFIDKRTNEKIAQLQQILYSLFSVADNAVIYTKSVNISNVKTKKNLLKKIEKTNQNVMKNLLRNIK